MSISRALNMCLDTIEEFFRKDKTMKKLRDRLLQKIQKLFISFFIWFIGYIYNRKEDGYVNR